MKMKSLPNGIDISRSPVSSIAAEGFWLLADDREFFVPFADYPVFRGATILQIFNVQRIAPQQYRWAELDADIELDALEHPERYPLIWREKRKRAR
jgi:hypothetical protein